MAEPPIGGGGFADVYRAVDLRDPSGEERVVAVKVLKDVWKVDPEVVARFRHELELLRDTLHHKNIVRVIACDDDSDGLWYAMPLAVGSLADELSTLKGDDVRTAEIMAQVSAAVAYAHEHGVFHRDLKPANVLRTSSDVWAVSDFGFAREAERMTYALTSTLAGMGTTWYTAPEQWKDAKRVTASADVFSLGKILQTLVMGEVPVNDDVPASVFRPVILKAIDSKPDRRYQTVNAFFDAVEAALGAPTKTWESTAEIAARLSAALSGAAPHASELLDEVVEWAVAINGDDHDDMVHVLDVLISLTSSDLVSLWARHAAYFKDIFGSFTEFVRTTGFPFAKCDPIADFIARVIDATGEPSILRQGLRALCALGASHNRWHVGTVTVSLLQAIKDSETAVTALEGLREADPSDVAWTVNDFARRSLHPVLREGLGKIIGS